MRNNQNADMPNSREIALEEEYILVVTLSDILKFYGEGLYNKKALNLESQQPTLILCLSLTNFTSFSYWGSVAHL